MVGRRCSILVSLAVAAIVGVGSAPAWAAAQPVAPARPGNVTIYLSARREGRER